MEAAQVAAVTGLNMAQSMELLSATQNDVTAAINKHFEASASQPPSERGQASPGASRPSSDLHSTLHAPVGSGYRDEQSRRPPHDSPEATGDSGMAEEQARWLIMIESQAKQVDSILHRCEESGNKFKDDVFPAGLTAIQGCTGQEEVVAWKRPGDFGNGGQLPAAQAFLFKDDMVADDVIQGRLKDCWLLGAFSIAAAKARALQERVVFAWVDKGLYAVEYFVEGSWVRVVVDDLIPCGRDGLPVFGRCLDKYCVWVPIMEKAFAKLMGGYSRLEYGSEDDGLVALTGGIPKSLDLHKRQETLLDGSMWRKLLKYQSKGHLMGCANHGLASDSGSIQTDHAYAVLAVHDLPECGLCLLHVRNPWGRGEWTGRFSRGSPMWGEVSESAKKQIGYYTWQGKRTGGSFFICWEDFYSHFDRIYVCKIIPSCWETVTVKDCEWRGETAGGCTNHNSCADNPQFRLIVSQPTEVRVRLFQTSRRVAPASSSSSSDDSYKYAQALSKAFQRWNIGMYLLRAPSVTDTETALLVLPPENIVVSSKTFLNAPQSTIKASVSPAGAEACFVLVPCTYHPGQEGRFAITVSSSKPVVFERIAQRPRVTSLRGAWDATSGGCMNNASWRKNPSYLLSLSADVAKISAVLQVDASSPYPAIGLYCFRGKPGVRQGGATNSLDTSDLLASPGSFVHGRQTLLTMHALQKGEYILVPTCYRPGEFIGGFKVSVSSEPIVDLSLECVFAHTSTQRPGSAVQQRQQTGNGRGVFANVLRPGSAQSPSRPTPAAEFSDPELEEQIAIAKALSLSMS